MTEHEHKKKPTAIPPRPAPAQDEKPIPAPPIAREALRTPGQPLDAATRELMEPRFGRDFGDVRVHADARAAEAAEAVNALAYTAGQDVVFGTGQYAPDTSVGQALIARELAHVAELGSKAAAGYIQRAALPETALEAMGEPAAEKSDEVLAAGILDTQYAILLGWKQALDRFDKVLTSASDKETKPNFKKVIKSFLEDKLMGEIIKRSKVPGVGDAFALLGKLEGDVKRASVAAESATLRDFVVQHGDSIVRLQQRTLTLKDDFVTKVRKTREKMELAEKIGETRKGGKQRVPTVTLASTPESAEYAMMRMMLVETLEQIDVLLKNSTIESLYRSLSEEWIRQATTTGGMGSVFPANIIIRLKKDYTIMNAYIEGVGGQKIAEQMLKDFPNGVDVFRLRIPRRLVVYGDNGWPSTILNLDASNRNTNVGSYAEGNWGPLYRFVMAKGLPPTKDLKGD